MSAWIRRHPLLSLLLVFNTFGQALAFAPLVLRTRFGIELNTEIVLSLAAILFLLVPALIVTRMSGGRPGLRSLLGDVFRFDVRTWWWLVPLVAMPVLDVVLGFDAPDSGWRAGAVGSAYVTAFLPGLAWNFLSTNWWEEAVWMGVIQASLQDRYGPMRALLITTPLFTLEHLTVAFDDRQIGGGLPTLAALAVVIFFWRAFAAWLYNRTGSLALVGLTHAATNATGYFMLERLGVTGSGGLSMVLAGLVVLVATRGRLGHRRAPAVTGAGPVGVAGPAVERSAA